MNPIKTIRWWRGAAKDLRLWYIFRKVTTQNENMLEEEHKLRVDWLGRVYGVINLPEEVLGAAPQIQQAYVLQQVSDRGKVMNELRLSDMVYPEIERIEGAGAYLIVLWPEFENLSFWTIIGRLISTLVWFFIAWVTIKQLIMYWPNIVDFISKIV